MRKHLTNWIQRIGPWLNTIRECWRIRTIKIVSIIAASSCCYAVVLLTKYNLYTLPGEFQRKFQRETEEKIKAVQAQLYAREEKHEDIIGFFCMMNAPFLPPPEGIVYPAASSTKMSTEFDDSISDSELASVSSELFKKHKSNKSPTVVTPSKEETCFFQQQCHTGEETWSAASEEDECLDL